MKGKKKRKREWRNGRRKKGTKEGTKSKRELCMAIEGKSNSAVIRN